jgi:hypothetical protein
MQTGTRLGSHALRRRSCKSGITDGVTFNFSHVTLPDTVVYEISYNTSTHGRIPSIASPSDLLSVAVTDVPSVGASTDANIWIDGVANAGVGNHAPAVQFKAGNGS